ncbi:MAG TPA: efflux RND transporter periplasmic adaptor subunit [Longimicrobiales bacterium]
MQKQLIVSGGIIGIAGVAVAAFVISGSGNSAPQSADAHNHGAPASAAVASPVNLDPERARRIGITYAIAEAGPMTSVVHTVGSITYDETRLVNVSPKIEGWVEKLYVDFTGAPVTRGQLLMAVYSPMLVSAQEELILAKRLVETGGTGAAAANARELLEAARRRLAYWDIAPSEIERIERSGTPQKTLVLRAPTSGLVVEKAVLQGQRIMPGMDLYRIADLSKVWVEGEVFEKDLALITVGRNARITFESYPGETFSGKVSYVYPTITADSRTGRIRIELANRNLRFKPGMYANLEFDVPIHSHGIHIPRSAVLQTGERTIAFVRMPDGTLAPREIEIGIATTEHVEVLSGITAGEVVVASANFLVDAESNLGAALNSMETTPAKRATAPPPQQHKH